MLHSERGARGQRVVVEEHRGGCSHSRSRSRYASAFVVYVGATLPSEVVSLSLSVACGCKSSLARARVFGCIFVVPLVAVACSGSRAPASARMRDPLLVVRRWFGCVSSFVCVNDFALSGRSRCFGAAGFNKKNSSYKLEGAPRTTQLCKPRGSRW